MIKLISVIALTIFGYTLQAQNLTIIDQDFEEAKKTAIKEHKLLIIDFYTEWCGPCKVLDKTIFQNEKHSKTISEKFIVLKYDAENDSAHNLSLKHHISSYPTTVIINAENGKTIDKKYGFGGSNIEENVANYFAFLDEAIKLNNESKFIQGISAEVKLNYPEFYKNAVYRIKNTSEKEMPIYWESNQDYFSEVSFCILAYFGGTKEINDFFLTNKQKYIQLYGEKDVQYVLNKMVYKSFELAIEAKDNKLFEDAKQLCEENCDPKEIKITVETFELEFWQATGNWSKVVERIEFKKDELITTSEMNDYCWRIFEKCEDKLIIKKAVIWMKELSDKTPTYAILDTYANLLYKSGDKKNAIIEMDKAIEKGKKEGGDTKESEAILLKFKK